MSKAVPAPLLATTAQPFVCQIAMPSGLVPTVMGLPSCCPNVGLAGLRSIFTTLLQPVTLTKAKGDKGPLAIWSAMATEDGCVFVAPPPEEMQALDKSTWPMTRKSTELDCTPLPLIRVSA